MYTQHFPAAPMSTAVRLATAFTFLLMAVILGLGLFTGPGDVVVWRIAMVGTPLLFLVISPFFAVRSYTLEDECLRIQRLGWHSNVDLRHLSEFHIDPEAMKGSWRVCGNGGLFCYSGYFRSKKLGGFRPFVTDPKRSVIIRTAEKTWVVSPEHPEGLVEAMAERFGAVVGVEKTRPHANEQGRIATR